MIRIGIRHKDCCFGNYNVTTGNRKAFEAAKASAETQKPVIISGSVGTGKTHLMVSITRDLQKENVSIAFWPVLDLVQKLRGNYDETFVDGLLKVPVLIIDDLGAERTTEFILETIEYIIDYRYRQVRPVMIGTNLDMKEMLARYGNRFLSRMSDGPFVRITGSDHRLGV